MAYIYKHTRLDTNEVFYIGAGSDTEGKYTRAYNRKGRSFSWKDIGKRVAYQVDIIIDNITWEDACQEEIKLIAKYGRKDLGKGLLTNLTDGGEGQYGRKDSEETRLKKRKPKNHPPNRGNNISIAKKGKPNPKLSESRTNQPHPKVGWRVNQLNEQGECIKEWESSKHAGEALNIAPDLIRAAARGVQKTAGGYRWVYNNETIESYE